jgi:hypothetical protein
MKVNFKFLVLFLTVFIFSCEEKELVINENAAASGSSNKLAPNGGTVMVGYGDIFSLYINNGLTTTCTKNILVFPSWQRYEQVIDQLDAETETYCNAFDALQPAGQSDLDYENACAAANFDEDKKIVQFENNLTFCSLRKKLVILEDNWLAIQGDGVWDINADPDNHFIDDDTERAMLNEGVEVIIGTGTRLDPYIMYKFTADGGHYTIPLAGVNAGVAVFTPANQTSVIQLNTSGTIGSNPAIKFVPAVVYPPTPTCKQEVKDVSYHYGANNSRLKQISKIKREWGENLNSQTAIAKGKIKCKTKGYVKKSGSGWKGKRTWITAGINGSVIGNDGFAFDNCTTSLSKLLIKEKRRRKVKVKTTIDPFVGVLPTLHYFTIQDNQLYSLHKQGQTLIINKDFYDMSNN